MEVEDDSKKFLCVNTPKGLFVFNRMTRYFPGRSHFPESNNGASPRRNQQQQSRSRRHSNHGENGRRTLKNSSARAS